MDKNFYKIIFGFILFSLLFFLFPAAAKAQVTAPITVPLEYVSQTPTLNSASWCASSAVEGGDRTDWRCTPLTEYLLLAEYEGTSFTNPPIKGYGFFKCLAPGTYNSGSTVTPSTITDTGIFLNFANTSTTKWGLFYDAQNSFARCKRIASYNVSTGAWGSSTSVTLGLWTYRFKNTQSTYSQIWSSKQFWFNLNISEVEHFINTYQWDNTLVEGSYMLNDPHYSPAPGGGGGGSWGSDEDIPGWQPSIIQPISGDWGSFDFLREGFNVLIETFNQGFHWLSDFFKSISDWFVEGLQNLFVPEEGYFSEFGEQISTAFNEKINVQGFKNMLDSLQNAFINNNIEMPADITVTIFGRTSTILSFSMIDNSIGTIRTILSSLLGVTFFIVIIPKFISKLTAV